MSMTVSASEFKAKCLDYFDKLSRREIDSITVTKRGKTVAMVWPPKLTHEEARSVHGSMAGRVIIPPGLDLTKPICDEEFDAEKGILHR